MKKYIVYENINWQLDCQKNIWDVHMCGTFNDQMPVLPLHVCSDFDEAKDNAQVEYEKLIKRCREFGCNAQFEFVNRGLWTVFCEPKLYDDGTVSSDRITGEQYPSVWMFTIGIMDIDD